MLERGFDPELGAFKQSYERSVPDASNLLIPLQEFLPFEGPRVRETPVPAPIGSSELKAEGGEDG